MSLPILIQLAATTQALGSLPHLAELREIWDAAKHTGGIFRGPPTTDKHWEQCEAADWCFAVQVLKGGKAVHCHLFHPRALHRYEVDEASQVQRISTPEGPFVGLWECGGVLREVANAAASWMDALETGLVEPLGALSPAADALMHHLTDGQYTLWYLEIARQKTLKDMKEITQEAQRPLRVTRQDVKAVGPRIREQLSSNG